MQLTPKLNLKKPDLTDSINVQDLNDNMDVLDTAVSELQEGSASIPDLETNDKTLAGAINEIKQTVNDVETNAQQHEVDYVKHPAYAGTTFASNVYSVTLDPPLTAYKDGVGLVLKLNATPSAGTIGINVDGLGNKSVYRAKGTSANASMFVKDGIYEFRYSATANNGNGAFILQGESEVEVGKQIITPSTVNQAITQGVHDGTGYVVGSPNLLATNIKSGVQIFGAVGTYTGELSGMTTQIVNKVTVPKTQSFLTITGDGYRVFQWIPFGAPSVGNIQNGGWVSNNGNNIINPQPFYGTTSTLRIVFSTNLGTLTYNFPVNRRQTVFFPSFTVYHAGSSLRLMGNYIYDFPDNDRSNMMTLNEVIASTGVTALYGMNFYVEWGENQVQNAVSELYGIIYKLK